jgi:hypothetical protein
VVCLRFERRDHAAGGKRGKAGALLEKIDGRYGGLAAPESIELAELLDAPR